MRAGARAGGPHAAAAVTHLGAPPELARGAVVFLHGRGASAGEVAAFARALRPPGGAGEQAGLAWVAPQADEARWYPYGFMEPIERNQPHLDGALDAVGRVVEELVSAGVAVERIGLLGFSQGACLALEFAARNARRYGALIGLSGGLIGPPGTARAYPGSLAGTPVFLGCSDRDPHIPVERVRESEAVLARLGGRVTARIYPGMGHTVNEDELAWARQLVNGLVTGEDAAAAAREEA